MKQRLAVIVPILLMFTICSCATTIPRYEYPIPRGDMDFAVTEMKSVLQEFDYSIRFDEVFDDGIRHIETSMKKTPVGIGGHFFLRIELDAKPEGVLGVLALLVFEPTGEVFEPYGKEQEEVQMILAAFEERVAPRLKLTH